MRHFKAALHRAGLSSSFPFHDLRHTAATLMIAGGVPLKTVSDILGHSPIQVTADTYGYSFEEDKQRALNTLAQVLGKKPRPRMRIRARRQRRSRLNSHRKGMSYPDAAHTSREARKLLPRQLLPDLLRAQKRNPAGWRGSAL